MKHSFKTAGISFLLFLCGFLFAEVKHVIVYTDGASDVGLIDSISVDSVYFHDFDTVTQQIKSMKKVYYIYNNYNRIYYFSFSLHRRLDILEERGGLVITTNNDTIPFDRIRFDRHMRDPRAYLYSVESPVISVNLLEIQEVQSDLTIMENSVKKGFQTGIGIFLTGTALSIIRDWSESRQGLKLISVSSAKDLVSDAESQIKTLLPKFSKLGLNNTGARYQSMNFIIPVFTMGWMVYDFYFGKYTQFISPVERNNKFPRDMFVFSFKAWTKEKWDGLKKTIFERPIKTPDEIPEDQP